MTKPVFNGIEILPETAPVRQLFILLHGVGGKSSDLLPLANKLRNTFPGAAFLLPDGTYPFTGGGNGRQWFPPGSTTEENRVSRVAEAMPALHTLVRNAQDRLNILQSDTALVGFSQGAIMALEFSVAHDGNVGRVLAFAGRFAKRPESAPELTTLHLLHGEDDTVIPVAHAHAAHKWLKELDGDATLDVESSVGHELHPILSDRAIHRLKTCIPLRSWKQAMNNA